MEGALPVYRASRLGRDVGPRARTKLARAGDDGWGRTRGVGVLDGVLGNHLG